MLPPAVRARAGAAVCLWPSASVCLFEGTVPRAGRAARHRPARQEWKSKVTRDSLAQPGHTPPPAHRHQDHCRWFKGDTGPGGRGGGSTQRTAHSPHLWCVGVSPPGVFLLLVVAVCLGPAPPRRLEKALDVADTAPLLGWAEKLADWAGRGRHTTPMINDDGTVPLLLAVPGPSSSSVWPRSADPPPPRPQPAPALCSSQARPATAAKRGTADFINCDSWLSSQLPLVTRARSCSCGRLRQLTAGSV